MMKPPSLARTRVELHALDTFAVDTPRWVAEHLPQIVAAITAASVAAVALLLVRAAGARRAERGDGNSRLPRVIAAALAKIHGWFVAAVAAQIFATFAHLPAELANIVTAAFVVAATLQAAISAREIVLGLIEYRAEASDHAGLQSALGLIRLLVTLALFAVASVLILSNLGVNVTGLIAGLGVGGIAIGLAAQGVFGDLFAALAILFDRPFAKGDTIKFGATTGTVEAIGLKSTRVRAPTGELIVIANRKLLDLEIQNLTGVERRRITSTLLLKHGGAPERLAALPARIAEIVRQEGATPVRCGVTGWRDIGVEFELAYDVPETEAGAVAALQHRVTVAVLAALLAAGTPPAGSPLTADASAA